MRTVLWSRRLLRGGIVTCRFVATAALTVALVVITSATAFAQDEGATALGAVVVAPDDKIDLRVLYAGNPESERMRDFQEFLAGHFTSVATADYESITAADMEGHDVVILDWTSIYPRDENGKVDWANNDLKQPKPPEITREFGRPVVMIGAAAGGLSHKLQTAINWKCLCLENQAHDVNTSHAIFQGPRTVKLDFVEREKPIDYFLYPGTEKLGETMKVWTVQEKSFPEIDPGLVSSRENFTKTPDAEVISGGVNGKGPTSVAIGRHGNFLLWGFSGQPSEMTESGRNAFVNAVCYITKFDGQTPSDVVTKYGLRESLLADVYWLRSMSDAYINRQANDLKRRFEETPPPEETRKQIGDDPEAYLRKMFASHAETVRQKIPSAVRETCGDDTEKLIRYYDDNLEYLRYVGMERFEVDEDVRELRVSNRRPELLEKCVAMLEAGKNTELAARVLGRYTNAGQNSAAEWRAWLEKEKKAGLEFDEGRGEFR